MKKIVYYWVHNLIKAICWTAAVLLVGYSCKNDYETINALTSELNIPDVIGYDVETVYHDSGQIQGKIVSHEINKYDRVDEPYIEFPQGLTVYFYDQDESVESYIQANFATYYQKTELWEARNEVKAENYVTGEKLETEQLFWNQQEKTIHSEKFSKITNADGVFYGEEGFDANEDLSQWTLKGSKGTAIVNDEPTE